MKQDHLAKWSSNLTGESLKVRHHPNRFGGHKHCGIGDIMVVVCYVTLQNHKIKALYEFMAKSPSKQVTILPNLVAIGTVVMEI